MALPLFEALSWWAEENQANGKIEQIWSFAGLQGGGGIVNVDSLEDLDTLMTSFPLNAFSATEILPLVDFEPSIENARKAIRAMIPPGA